MPFEPPACEECLDSITGGYEDRRDLRRSMLYAEAAPVVPPPPPHVRESILTTPSVCSAPRSQSSSGLAALCFCVQMDQAQIPDWHTHRMAIQRDNINSGMYVRHRFPGILQRQSLRILRHHLLTGTLTKSPHSPDGVLCAHAL